MAKREFHLESNFRVAAKAGREATQMAVAHAVDEGQEEAASRLDKGAGKRGYNLHGSDVSKEVHVLDGKIIYNEWYGHFFEYGTVHIRALPFIRPGHRKMRKVFRETMAADFEKWVRRRAGMR